MIALVDVFASAFHVGVAVITAGAVAYRPVQHHRNLSTISVKEASSIEIGGSEGVPTVVDEESKATGVVPRVALAAGEGEKGYVEVLEPRENGGLATAVAGAGTVAESGVIVADRHAAGRIRVIGGADEERDGVASDGRELVAGVGERVGRTSKVHWDCFFGFGDGVVAVPRYALVHSCLPIRNIHTDDFYVAKVEFGFGYVAVEVESVEVAARLDAERVGNVDATASPGAVLAQCHCRSCYDQLQQQ